MKKSFITKIIGFSIVSASLFACSSQDDFPIDPTKPINTSSNKYFISLEEASKSAENVIKSIERQTRSGASLSRSIKSVDYLVNPSTRSGESSDTLLYLINYNDDQGFALMAADKRLEPIYAISEEGHLNFSDTISNPGLAMFLKNTKASINQTLEMPPLPLPEDSTYYIGTGELPFGASVTGIPIEYPMTHLDQYYPFNKYAPILRDTIHYPAGCGPVAFAIYLSRFKKPSNPHNIKMCWDFSEGKEKHYDSMAHLLDFASTWDALRVEYSYDIHNGAAGICDTEDFLRAFSKFSYETDRAYWQDFNAMLVARYITNGKARGGYGDTPTPLVVTARTTYDENDPKRIGHFWIIDTYLTWNPKLLPPNEERPPLYHCIWGWGGQNNGYFIWEQDFYPDEDSMYLPEIPDNDIPLNYQHDFIHLQFLSGYHPRN